MTYRDQYGAWALIVGASVTVGEQFARQLGAKGMNVAMVARRGERLGARERHRRFGKLRSNDVGGKLSRLLPSALFHWVLDGEEVQATFRNAPKLRSTDQDEPP